jgi:hypothetical protein
VDVGSVGQPLVEDLEDAVRPAGGDRGPAVAVGVRRQVAEHAGLVRRVQPGAGKQLGELVPLVRVAGLLEGDQVGVQAPQLLVQQAGAPRVALVVLHVDSQYPQAHRAQERGAVIGTTSAFLDLAVGLGPATLGLVAAAVGRPGTFLAGAGVAAAGLLLVWTRPSNRWSRPCGAVAPGLPGGRGHER